MTGRHRWLRLVCALLLLAGVGKALRDLSVKADKADDPREQPLAGALFDYRDTVFNPSRDLLHGDNPYDHVRYLQRHPGTQEFNVYTPSWFVIAVPGALLPYHAGQAVWWLAVVAGVALLALVSLRAAEVEVDPFVVVGLTGLLLLSSPGQDVLRSGQQAFLFAACLFFALLWGRDRPWLGALALVVLSSKPQFLIPVFVLLVACRAAWPMVVRWIPLLAAVSLLPTIVLVIAAGGVGDLITSIFDNLDYSSGYQYDLGPSSDLVRVDALNALGKLEIARPTTTWQYGLAVVFLALAVLAVRRVRFGSAIQLVLVATATLVSFPHYPYDAAIVVPVVVVLAAGARGADRLPDAVRWVLLALLAEPLIHTFQVDGVLDRAGVSRGAGDAIGSLCVLAAFLLAIVYAIRTAPRRAAAYG